MVNSVLHIRAFCRTMGSRIYADAVVVHFGVEDHPSYVDKWIDEAVRTRFAAGRQPKVYVTGEPLPFPDSEAAL